MNMNKIETLMVCGDSFQDTGVLGHEGTHWSEIVSSRLNLNLLNMASKGCSSIAVAFQLLHAENVPNCFVVESMAAAEMRFEITSETLFGGKQSIDNFHYGPGKHHPLGNQYQHRRHIRSIPMTNLEEADQQFFLNKYSYSLKRQTDLFAVLYALRKLRHRDIPVLFFQGLLGPGDGPHKIDMEEFKPYIEEHCIIPESEMNIFGKYIDVTKMTQDEMVKVDPGYHTSYERQIEIADYMTEKIKDAIQMQVK